ncbi:MAG: hypothetical protein R3F24_13895 [Gammaproteobacteria bacterium]
MAIDPAWAGKVQFYELVFGTWTAYVFLVFLWEKILGTPLAEWRYVLLSFMGAGAFWVNHYFQHAPFWFALLNTYTLIFLVAWWQVGVRQIRRSAGWKLAGLVAAILYTIAFIGFEQIARLGVERYGIHEFWFMAASYIGFIAVIVWRGRRSRPETALTAIDA